MKEAGKVGRPPAGPLAHLAI